jgi:thiosulfate reductase cytochrome b subunit
MAKTIYKKHPLAIRWFHWINFPVLFIMIWSGFCIYWANHVYTFTLFGHTYFKFFPDSWFAPPAPSWWPVTPGVDDAGHAVKYFWEFDARLAEGLYWHFCFAWFFAINGFLYVVYLIGSGEWRQIVPKLSAFRESIDVVLTDLHLKKGPLPVRKYNAAQQIAYTMVIVMGALMVLTGLAIYKPAQQGWLTRLFFGYTVARFIHFWTTISFLGFFVVHVGQVIRTGWNNFRGMVSGSEIVTEEERSILEVQAGGANV